MFETDAMRTVKITVDEDQRLENVAPSYLKGGGKMEARVRWALLEFLTEQEARLPPGSPPLRGS